MLVQTADLLTRVAAIVPTPSAALCADDDAWLAFNDLLDDAAGLVAHVLGHPAAPALRELLGSLAGTDAVAWLLTERVLGVLGRD
ncbi:hypothetical protein BL253_08235 [Pseudofrankia asymbiotica]|uniref:Uncharacterized protein n=1 Tax=Pseudofrankia asymbiotica TaxID=1834516 RepID=A0A1V2IFH5_9ACTN|nr:hypothetical protein BL253_08235 [Pseudofrankia asymbiotica]